MVETVPTVLAVGAGALMLTALVAISVGELTIAGLCFLSASLVIYFRETQRQTPQESA